jgi:hypothetical protein
MAGSHELNMDYKPPYNPITALHQAMVRDTSGELKSLVEQFMGATDLNSRNALMRKILLERTGADSAGSFTDPSQLRLHRFINCDNHRLAVLEQFFGLETWGYPFDMYFEPLFQAVYFWRLHHWVGAVASKRLNGRRLS